MNRSHSKELGIDWDFKALTGSGEYRRESWNEQRYVTDDAGNIKYDKMEIRGCGISNITDGM